MRIYTEHPIAVDSNDHLIPHGTVRDRSDATKFCEFVRYNWPEKQTLLDLGTANGTVVTSAVYQGFDAYGIEGSDAPRLRQAEIAGEPWNNYYNVRLFHADLRYPFTLSNDDTLDSTRIPYRCPVAFDIITAWDVLEHMTEETIDTVMENIRKHSKTGTFVMATIQFDAKNNQLYHHLLKPRGWWINKFDEFGFKDKGDSPMLNMVRKVAVENRFWFEKTQ